MTSPELDLIDVLRDERWSQVVLMAAASVADARAGADQVAARGGSPFVAVVSADLGPDAAGIMEALRPGLQEIVCCDQIDQTDRPGESGQDFAMRALDELRFGQDFVFTVPALEDAIDHAVVTLQRPDHGGWEGRFVVVVGPGDVIDRARRHLTGLGT